MAKKKDGVRPVRPTVVDAVAAEVAAVPEGTAFGSSRDAADAAAHATSAMAEADRRGREPVSEAVAAGEVPTEAAPTGGSGTKPEPGAVPDDDTALVDGHDAILEAARLWRVY